MGGGTVGRRGDGGTASAVGGRRAVGDTGGAVGHMAPSPWGHVRPVAR
jgi:hypothetical protein